MKAISTVPGKGKRLESLKVEPSEQPVSQANKEDLDNDLVDFPELRSIKLTFEKLLWTPAPGATDCEDESLAAYKKACSLLIYADYAEKGLMAEGSGLVEPAAGDVMQSIQLQLEIVRLAGKRLYSMCQAHDSRESADSCKSGDSRNS